MGSEVVALRYHCCLAPWGRHLLFYQMKIDEDLIKLTMCQPHNELTHCFKVPPLQAGEVVWVKCFLFNHKYLSSDLQHPFRSYALCAPVTPVMVGSSGRWTGESLECWPTNLAEQMDNLAEQMDTLSQKIKWTVVEEDI